MRVIELRLTDASPHDRGRAYGGAVAREVCEAIDRYRRIDWFAGPPSGLTAATVRRFGPASP